MEFVEEINQIARMPGYELVFCAGDAEVLALSAHRDKLVPLFPYTDHDSVLGVFDKLRLAELATNVAESPPHRPSPLSQDDLLGLFSGDQVGREVVLEPATLEDLCDASTLQKPSLEVVYDNA